MNAKKTFHTEMEVWSQIYALLHDIKTLKMSLCKDKPEKVIRLLEVIEKEIDILTVLIKRI